MRYVVISQIEPLLQISQRYVALDLKDATKSMRREEEMLQHPRTDRDQTRFIYAISVFRNWWCIP